MVSTSIPCAETVSEREYQRQQELTASDYEYAERFRKDLDIEACNAYSDPSSEYVIDALNNDDDVRASWSKLVNCYTDDSQEILASCAREFISNLERYVKACPEIIRKADESAR